MRSPRRVALLLFAVAWGANHFVPLLLVYRARLELSSVELAVLFGVYALGLVPGLLLAGPLSDWLGRRTVVLPASVVALAGTCILACGACAASGTEGFVVLLAGRFVVGLGAGATFSAGTAWVQDLAASEPLGTGARRATVALSGGFGGGPLVAGILAQWLPWPMVLPFVVHGAVLVSSIAAVAWPGGPAGESASPPHLASPLASPRHLASPLASPRHLASPLAPRSLDSRRLPAGFAGVAVVAPWVFVFPSVAGAVIPALVRAKIGAFAVVFAGVTIGATLLCGVLVQPMLRPWPRRRVSAFGLAAGAAGLLCGAVAAREVSPAAALLAALLLGAGYGGCLIAGLQFIEASTTFETRGRLTGLYYALTYLGFASPLALAQVARVIGDVPSLLGASGLAAVTLLGALGARPRMARRPPS